MSDELDPIGSPSRTCATCAFQVLWWGGPGIFECHRFPPTIVVRNPEEGCVPEPEAEWPEVDPGDWCGEHRPRPAPNEPPRQGG